MQRKRNLLGYTAIYLSYLFVYTLTAQAETRSVLGLPLPYEELTQVDSKNSRLTVGGKTVLIPSENVDGVLVEQAFKNRAILERLPISGLNSFNRAAIEQDREAIIYLGIYGLITHPKVTADDVEELLSLADGHKAAAAALKRIIDDRGMFSDLPNQICIPILFEVGIADLSWLRERALSLVIANKKDFKNYAKGAFSRSILARRFARLPGIAALLKEVYGVEDAQFQESKVVADQLAQFEQNLRARDVSSIEIGMVSLKANEEHEKLLFPYLIEEIHRAAREELDKGEPVTALKVLTLVDLSYRTKTTHSLTTLIVSRLEGQNMTILSDTNARNFISALSHFDAGVKNAAATAYEKYFYSALGRADFTQADSALEGVLGVRADPNSDNDTMRLDYSILLRHKGLRSQSESLLADVQTGIPLMLRIEMFSEDVLGASLTTLLLEAIVVLIVLLFLVNRAGRAKRAIEARLRAKREREAQIEDAEEEEKDDGGEMPRGSRVRGAVFKRMDKISPERAEYNRCLMLLGLSPTARFKEIRAAYRKAVKTHHPDMKGDSPEVVSDKFVDVTQTYERILQLREMMLMDEKD